MGVRSRIPGERRSRIHGSRKVLGELRRLQAKALRLRTECRRVQAKSDSAALHRAQDDVERAWCHRVAEDLEQRAEDDSLEQAIESLVLAGEAVLPGYVDPRPLRKARKRVELFR